MLTTQPPHSSSLRAADGDVAHSLHVRDRLARNGIEKNFDIGRERLFLELGEEHLLRANKLDEPRQDWRRELLCAECHCKVSDEHLLLLIAGNSMLNGIWTRVKCGYGSGSSVEYMSHCVAARDDDISRTARQH